MATSHAETAGTRPFEIVEVTDKDGVRRMVLFRRDTGEYAVLVATVANVLLPGETIEEAGRKAANRHALLF